MPILRPYGQKTSFAPQWPKKIADVVEPVELFVDAATGRVSKLGTVQNDHIWGDVATEVSYGGWSTPPGGRLMFPHQVELSIAGKTIRTARRGNVVVNPDFPTNAFALPEEPRTQTDPAAAERGNLTSQYLTRWHALARIMQEIQIQVRLEPIKKAVAL